MEADGDGLGDGSEEGNDGLPEDDILAEEPGPGQGELLLLPEACLLQRSHPVCVVMARAFFMDVPALERVVRVVSSMWPIGLRVWQTGPTVLLCQRCCWCELLLQHMPSFACTSGACNLHCCRQV